MHPVYVGFIFGFGFAMIAVALDRYLFTPFTERTAERAKKERWFKTKATQDAIANDTDTRV